MNDLLDLKMIEMGEFVSRKEPFQIHKTFQFILDIFQLQADQQLTSIQFQIEDAPMTLL